MAIQHENIADANRHEAKGASTATNGQVLKANGDGTTSFTNPNTLVNIGVASTLQGISTTTQNPSGTNTPYQVIWGAGSSNSNATIAGTGVVTINTTGLYFITFNLNFSRSSDTGISILFARLLVNDIEVGFVQCVKLDANTAVVPFNASILRSFTANDTIKVQIIRDSGGTNDGGLYTVDPALSGWSNSPSAAIRIQKIAGGA